MTIDLPLKNTVYYNSGLDVLRVHPDVPHSTEQINAVVDILWMNDPHSGNEESIFAGFALHGVIYLLHKNKIHLVKPQAPASFVFNLFIKKYGENILDKYKKKIHTIFSTVQDDIINIPTR